MNFGILRAQFRYFQTLSGVQAKWAGLPNFAREVVFLRKSTFFAHFRNLTTFEAWVAFKTSHQGI